jgi:hypothetical protein
MTHLALRVFDPVMTITIVLVIQGIVARRDAGKRGIDPEEGMNDMTG